VLELRRREAGRRGRNSSSRGGWGYDNNIITTYNFIFASCVFCAAIKCHRRRRETIIELHITFIRRERHNIILLWHCIWPTNNYDNIWLCRSKIKSFSIVLSAEWDHLVLMDCGIHGDKINNIAILAGVLHCSDYLPV